ncbi:MAG: phosphoadenylyl-sulfate reductase [Chloroflexi bacterium]|nr:phosphoadenylyl-sulfate reductase [Chloroflexota bacterium]
MTTVVQQLGQTISAEELKALNRRFESASPQEILRWADSYFGPRAAIMSSFGLEDVALTDMYWRINPKVRVMTLETGRLPTETYTVMDQIKGRYDLEIEAFYPEYGAVADMVAQHGFNLFYKSVDFRKMCCGVRKVAPLNRALATLDAWVTGLRRDQGMARGLIQIVEWDAPHNNYKINPLANWNFEQVREYVRDFKVPYNELHDKGYPSIGCAPCTRAIKPGEDLRAGRWWWENDPNAKECGLHVVQKADGSYSVGHARNGANGAR